MEKSYTLEELIPIIEHCALDLMDSPIMAGKKSDGTVMNLTDVAAHNSMLSMENSGIRLMSQALIDDLKRKDAGEVIDDG